MCLSLVQVLLLFPSWTYPYSKVPSDNDNIELVTEAIHILGLDLHPTTAYNTEKQLTPIYMQLTLILSFVHVLSLSFFFILTQPGNEAGLAWE